MDTAPKYVFADDIRQEIPFASEEIEPFAALYIGRMFARCEAARKAGDLNLFEDMCCSMWWGLEGLQHVATAVSTAVHFTLALQNHQRQIARYIEQYLDFSPYDREGWGNYTVDQRAAYERGRRHEREEKEKVA